MRLVQTLAEAGADGLMNDRFSSDDLSRKSDAGARASPRPVDLAHAKPFKIGSTDVRPSTREVLDGGRRELLEPLVMQVLLALSSARGETVSRDDLIDACWRGRIVTDDAISRVISRLRSLGRTFGSFEVETITKVGYRLMVADEPMVATAAGMSRRKLMMAGGAVAAVGLAGLTAWLLDDRPREAPGAALLLQKGMDALQNNDALDLQDSGTSEEAIAFLTEATRAAPQSATAWGALALAYSSRKRVADVSERSGLDARSRAAARKALELDPAEARALGALRLLDPVYRNWLTVERADLAAVEKNPTLPILNSIMSDMLANVGRWTDAVAYSKRLDRTRFLIPGAERKLILDLWATGDLQAADDTLDEAVKKWPQHPQIWRTRMTYLMYTGRAAEVLSILRATPNRPPELTPAYFETARVTAEGLANVRPAADSIAHNLAHLRANPTSALPVAQALVALGDKATASSILKGYYFGEGSWATVAPQGGDEDRVTRALFEPMMAPIWRGGEFNRLLERIGLNDYWRRSRTVPDFRRQL